MKRARGRFKELRSRVSTLPVSRIKPIDIPDELVGDGGRAERLKYYSSARWGRLRGGMLGGSCKTCFFCGARATVLEHVVGHGADALKVAAALGLPRPAEHWRERFWNGPFVGSCSPCARERSGYEASGRLLAYTEAWLLDKRAKY